MARDVDLATASWIRGSERPDPHGPVDVPYRSYDEAWFDRPVIEIIGELASRRRDHVAIDDGTMRLTYAQLYAMACRLSHGISRADLPSGPIGIKLQDGAFYIVGMLACLAAGRACLLLSQDNPPDYNQRLIEVCGLSALLVNASDSQSGTQPGGPQLIRIEPILETAADGMDRPAGRLGADEAAFIVSTSGSTGTPKLIATSQGGLHRRVANTVRTGHFNENDSILVLGAPAIGAAVLRRLMPLLIGATLHIVDIPRVGMGGILKALRENRITSMRTTASLLKALSQIDDIASCLGGLRLAAGGGEMLLQKDMKLIRALLPPGCLFAHALNMTETEVARWFVPENDDHDPVRVAAGYLAPETEVLVLGDDGRPCPVGEIGELIVRSKSVALGEWRDGRLLPDRFERDPTDPTKRIFRTGDMVRICPDGVMVVHGRKDRMIKIRGQRVDPALVEATMRNIAGVADAAVVAMPVDGGYRIHGFVVPSPRTEVVRSTQTDVVRSTQTDVVRSTQTDVVPSTRGDDAPDASGGDLIATVREALKAALPVYMRPYDIRLLDSLPINTSGKVDSATLLHRISADEAERASVISAAVVPRIASPQAREWVADAWRVAFGAGVNPAIGFDAAGGDSLKYMQIVFRLEQLSGALLPLDIFDYAMNQDHMASRLDRLLGGEVDTPAPGKAVFLIPGLGGDDPRLLQFRAGCAPDISLMCLDYGAWPQWVKPGFSFDVILRQMVARIQEAAPDGPLTLAGYSLGGQAALAIAADLCAAGREIEHVLILDSAAIEHNDVARAKQADFVPPMTWREEFHEWQRAHRRGEGAFALAQIVTRRLTSPRWAPLLRWLARHRRAVLPGQIDFYLSFHLQRWILTRLAADWRRSLKKVPRISSPVTVFRARDHKHDTDRDATAWGKHSAQAVVIPVDGDHFSMFDPPHLADLCEDFTAACTAKSERKLAVS